jgi:hypothetical protein
MPDLLAPTVDEMITCVEREIAMRRKVYPRWVEQKKLSQERADREIETMEEVSRTLHSYKGLTHDRRR